MSFGEFFLLFDASKPFDVRAYKRYVRNGQALSLAIDCQITKQLKSSIPRDVKQAIMQAQLIAAIDDPVNVLQHLAHYLAMNGDFWAAGRLHATFKAEKQRTSRIRNDRRKGARAVNAQRITDKRAWVEAAKRAGRRIRATQAGARYSDSKLAKHIVASREFASLETRRPSWHTVRVELKKLMLSRVARGRKQRS